MLNQFISSNADTLRQVYIELTPLCNNVCIGCGNVFMHDDMGYDQDKAGLLSQSQWFDVIRQLSPFIRRFIITGGEPTLSPHFKAVLSLIDTLQAESIVFTNGRWEHAGQIVDTLRNISGLKGILVSLHGKDAASHEAFTMNAGSFAETIRSVKTAVSSSINVSLNTVITLHNYNQTEEIYEFGKHLGAFKSVFNRYVGDAENNCVPSAEQLKHALHVIEAMRLEGKFVQLSTTVPQCCQPTSAMACGAGKTYITVDPWGNVRPCNHSPLILGNIIHEPLEVIMRSPALATWHSIVPLACRECAAFSICGGGCKAEAMLNHAVQDSLINYPFSKEKYHFMALPDHVRPVWKPDGQDTGLHYFPIDYLNGENTLKDVAAFCGQSALNFIGRMYNSKKLDLLY